MGATSSALISNQDYTTGSKDYWHPYFCAEHANQKCATCGGGGIKHVNHDVCTCVLRSVVRSTVNTLKLFRTLRHKCGTRTGFGRIEFDVDALKVAKRSLTDSQWRQFVAYSLCDMEWHEVAEPNSDRSAFFNEEGRIAVILGRAFRESSLYPAEHYLFTKDGSVAQPVPDIKFDAIRPPLKRSNLIFFPSTKAVASKRRRTTPARVIQMPVSATAA